jgi:Pyridoxamine 5'-phosphate oxidase
MSVVLGDQLTPALFERLNGRDVVSQAGKAIVLATIDENSWPHPAMLSYYEVVAKDLQHIDLVMAKTSTTARNLRRTGKVTLVLTDYGMNYYVKGNALELRNSLAEMPFLSLFRVRVERLLEDQEPEATITSGITFERPEKDAIRAMIEKVFRGIMQET